MIRIFTGYDIRESVGWHAFAQSVIENTREQVSFIPISGDQRDGTNAFTYARFLVPYYCDWQGLALFVDGADMLCKGDISELFGFTDNYSALYVVKHDYKTNHPRKYIGTGMEADNADYPRKNWSSVILWDCASYRNRVLTPEYVSKATGSHLHRFEWLPEDRIGELPKEWNWLADEYGENHEASLLHWTCGQPGFYHYHNAPHAQEWRKSVRNVLRGLD